MLTYVSKVNQAMLTNVEDRGLLWFLNIEVIMLHPCHEQSIKKTRLKFCTYEKLIG